MDLSSKTYTPEEGIKYLERLLRHSVNPQFRQMVQDGAAVHREYGQLFSPQNLGRMTAEDFKGFLLYENNRHWWGIHRHQAKLVSNMTRLRDVFRGLLDEGRDIADRVDWLEGVHGPKPLPGLGPAVYTPVLHVVYPDRYGVWNSVSEAAMRRLGVWPEFPWGATVGQRYQLMNQAITGVVERLGVDRWTLDSLWWLTEKEHEPAKHQFDGGSSTGGSSRLSRQSKGRDLFTCERCFQLKAGNLRRADTGYCIDCY